MRVLFVRSGNNGIDPISTSQGISIKNLGINISFYDVKGRGVKGYIKNIFYLRSHLKNHKYDIIHAHYYLSGIIASIVNKNIPIVVSLMGSDLYSNAVIRSIIRFYSIFKWNHTIVKSKEMYKLLKNEKASIIPNGIDLSLFKYIDRIKAIKILGWHLDKYNILFASNKKRPEKNYALADKALKMLDNSYQDKIELHFLTNLEYKKMFLYYNAADLLLLTSLHEGSPNVIKEAMACNCPIVATDVGDIREIISDTEGCYITSFDPHDVATKIKMAIEFSKIKGRTNGREKIQHLDNKLIAEKIINIYKKVLHENL